MRYSKINLKAELMNIDLNDEKLVGNYLKDKDFCNINVSIECKCDMDFLEEIVHFLEDKAQIKIKI